VVGAVGLGRGGRSASRGLRVGVRGSLLYKARGLRRNEFLGDCRFGFESNRIEMVQMESWRCMASSRLAWPLAAPHRPVKRWVSSSVQQGLVDL
jgi:hypothetical protein